VPGHPIHGKKISNLKNTKKYIFEIKDDHVLYSCKNISPWNFIDSWVKKKKLEIPYVQTLFMLYSS
jgi:hypothetical protein